MRILLTNDDGFEHPNIQAVFTALRAAGHDVILSAPYRDQSGTSALLGTYLNLPPTSGPSPAGRVAAGSPGAGPTALAADQYYVDSSPAVSALYGIEVLAPAKWSAPPDLVVSGPNDGNNLGFVTPHSGTVGAAITALNRGIPALAISAARDSAASLDVLGALVVRLVAAIEERGGVRLPLGVGLNVNFPPLVAGKDAASYRLALTRVGTAAANEETPSEAEVFSAGGVVTVSPIQGTYQSSVNAHALVLSKLRGLFTAAVAPLNPKFVNVSVRGWVGLGDAAQIIGFVVGGNDVKTVLVRASGPALAALGVSGVLQDPMAEVLDAQGRRVAQNDDWGADAQQFAEISDVAARVGAFAWPKGSKDAALLVTLPPGSFSVVVRGAGNTTGIALIEVYDAGLD